MSKPFNEVDGKESLPGKVLILSADETSAIACQERLEQEHFYVKYKNNLRDALEEVNGTIYQAVITDFILPDADALAVLDTVKEKSKDTIVIVITDETGELLLLKAMNAGASYCIPKVSGYREQLPYLIKLSLEQQLAFKAAASAVSLASQSTTKKFSSQTSLSAFIEYKGQLSNTTMPRLMRAFYQQQLTGALRVSKDGQITSFYFVDGAIAFARSPESETLLGEKLVNQRKISQVDLDAICKLMSDSGYNFTRAITKLGLMSLEELKPLLVNQVLKLVYSAFEWTEGDFIFELGVKLENEILLSLSTADVIFASIRRLKSRSLLEKWLGDCERVLIPTSDLLSLFQALTLQPNEISVIEKIDKPMSINQLLTLIDLDPETALRTICGLIETGMLVPFEAKAERLIVEVSKFAEFFEDIPLASDFDARSAAEFCYEVESLLQKFRFCDHYAVLDVGRKSSKEQITNAFREVAKKFHPDRHSQLSGYHLNLKTDLKTIFERVAEAYYTLTDDKRRSAYDLTLKSISTIAKGTGHFVDGKASAELGQSHHGTKPLPPFIPGMPGSDEYEVAQDFYRKRDFDMARKMLLEAVAEAPSNAEYQVALARSSLKLPEHIRQAETAYLKAIELAPRNSEYCAELGLFYQRFSQTAQARTMFKRALELDPNNPIALRVNM